MMRACHLNTCPVGVATQDPGAAQALQGPARARRQLLLLRRRGGAADHGPARHRPVRGSRSAASTCSRPTRRWSTGGRGGSTSRTSCAAGRADGAPLRRTHAQVSPLADALDWQLIEARPAGDRRRNAGERRARDPQRQPDCRRPALARGHQAARRAGPAAGHDPVHAQRVGRASRSAPGSHPGSSSRSSATRTTTPARGSPAG